ncbi:hypothetical protein H8959_004921 [Pygathrix nigripes]
MSNSDYLPDYPLDSDLVKRLKSALDAKDEERVGDLICTEVTPVDAVIELANDDWMKDPSAQLPPRHAARPTVPKQPPRLISANCVSPTCPLAPVGCH